MKFTLDTEFNGYKGELLSLALAPFGEFRAGIYLHVPTPPQNMDPWVAENVWPLMDKCPIVPMVYPVEQWGDIIAKYLADNSLVVPYIIADWPADIRYLCDVLEKPGGEMASVPRIQFDIVRVDSYPSPIESAVRHNAWWDAVVLRHHLKLFSGDLYHD